MIFQHKNSVFSDNFSTFAYTFDKLSYAGFQSYHSRLQELL